MIYEDVSIRWIGVWGFNQLSGAEAAIAIKATQQCSITASRQILTTHARGTTAISY